MDHIILLLLVCVRSAGGYVTSQVVDHKAPLFQTYGGLLVPSAGISFATGRKFERLNHYVQKRTLLRSTYSIGREIELTPSSSSNPNSSFLQSIISFLLNFLHRLKLRRLEGKELHHVKLPYTIFINRKSGGRAGKKLLKKLKHSVEPEFICDLNKEKPHSKLNQTVLRHSHLKDINNQSGVAICCGGDGTIRWIMDETHRLNLSENMLFGIIPMGTGNDFFNHVIQTYYNNTSQSRSIRSKLCTANLLFDTFQALSAYQPPLDTHNFDRWKVSIRRSVSIDDKSEDNKKVRKGIRLLNFNNYFGIGIDGDITATYDNLRKQKPYLFFHRLINKVWFAVIWFYKVIRGPKKNLSQDLEIYCDDEVVDIRSLGLRGLIFCNICSYAGGTNLWRFEGYPWMKQAADDNIVEV